MTCCLSFVYAQESKDEDQLQITDTQLDGGSVMNSLIDVPDTSFDSSNINAATQQNQINQQQRASQVEGIVRQEQNDPNLKRQRERTSNASATGMMSPNGRERDLQNLTDAERIMSDEFVHEGKADRILKENCRDDNRSACEGRQDPNAKGILGIDPGTMEMMAKAYSMIVGFAGGDFTKTVKAEGDATKKGAEESKTAETEEKSQTDYCRYIPMGIEAMAMFKQMSAQNQIQEMPSSSGSRQRDTLLQAAKSHDERAKQAQIQATGWTATTTCYIGFGIFVNKDWKYWLKLSGSALFTTYYWDSVDRHKSDANDVRKIANKLPSKGDCNPITDRLCYCTEEATKNDPDFCMPEIRDRYVDKMAEFTTPCINSKGQTDVACECRDSDSCFDRKIENSLRGVGFSTSDLQGIRPVQELSRGSLSSAGFNQAKKTNSALSNRIRKNFGTKLSEFAKSKKLTPKQQADADQLAKQGFPRPMAEILSSAPLSPGAEKKLAEMKNGNFGTGTNNTQASSYRSNGSSIRTSGGSGLDARPGTEEGPGNDFSDIMNKLNGEDGRETASGGQVLRFAERAQNAAQITKREDTFLFDIISHRYQKTAWKRFKVDFDALPAASE
jgi:hypothetical protein